MAIKQTKNFHKFRLAAIAPILSLGIIGNGCYLAGGALRTMIDPNEKVADFDLFFKGISVAGTVFRDESGKVLIPNRATEVMVTLEKERFQRVFACPKNELFTYKKGDIKVQIILVACGKPEQVISGFDFGACCAAYDGETFFYDKRFIRDVKTKKLTLLDVTFPVATLKRIAKYSQKGYNINNAAKSFVEMVSNRSFDPEQLRLYVD